MTVGALFDEAAGGYDEARRRLVPGLDELYGAVLGSIPFGVDQPIRVLDLGAGTGLLSAVVAERFPRARVTLVDLSVEMLRVARRRFASETKRFEFRVMDFARKELPAGYDLVVSALSIHHLTDGDKRETFEKVHGSLVAGGCFVNLDQVRGGTPEEEARYEEWWQRSAREAGATEDDLASAFRRMRADKNASLEDQLRWLEDAGFGDVQSRHDGNRFAVYAGRKKAEYSYNGKERDG